MYLPKELEGSPLVEALLNLVSLLEEHDDSPEVYALVGLDLPALTCLAGSLAEMLVEGLDGCLPEPDELAAGAYLGGIAVGWIARGLSDE
jgi:hypothetical protein